MTVDREKFISAGINYIYALDEYESSSVFCQVAKEFDDVIDLNQQEILEKRSKFIGIGKPCDYKNLLIKTDEGDVIAGIRHLGGDKNKPFVFVWPSFKIKSIKKITAAIFPCFSAFKPEYISYWIRPGCNDSNEKVIQQRFIGRIAAMEKSDFELSKVEGYYQWYKSEYDKFHSENPEYVNRITANSKAMMDDSFKDGLLYLYIQGGNKVGLISGERDVFLGRPAIYLNDILIGRHYRRKGYANKLLAGFINILDAEYFIGDIDSDNIPSTATALKSGQKIFSQEIFARI